MNDEAIEAEYIRLRTSHPELAARHLGWTGMTRILARERILCAVAPLPRPAKLIGYDGVWMVLVDKRRPERHTWYAAHELAHYKLHVEGSVTGHYEHCYNMDDFEGSDPREREAEYLASLIVGWYGR